MKSAVFTLLAASAGLVWAQSLSDLPQCAQACVGSSFGGCGTFDIKCICSNKNLLSNLSCCVAGSCSTSDQQKTIQFADQLCKSYGISLPTSATCASSASPTGTASSHNSTAVAVGTSTGTAHAANASSVSSEKNAAFSSGTTKSSGTSSASKSGTGSAAASTNTSGASALKGSDLSLAGAALAIFALL